MFTDNDFVSNESELVQNVVWSSKIFPLAEFVEKYELPQLVQVQCGYFGENERSTLSGGQLLTLHALNQTPKVVCEVCKDVRAIILPFLCPLKADVCFLPKDIKHGKLTATSLARDYKDLVKYVRVEDADVENTSQDNINDILKVKSIDEHGIQFSNVESKAKVFISYSSSVLFTPLLHYKQYTIAEIKQKFGFPAKVRFPESRIERQLRYRNKDSSTSISSLGEILILGEFEETTVVSTTICGSIKDKVCYNIPKDLEVTIAVAEGFLSGDKTYQKLVRTLHNGYKGTDLTSFESLDFQQHVDAVSKGIDSISLDVSTEQQVPAKIKEQFYILRQKAYFNSTTSFPTKPPPPIPARKTKTQTTPTSTPKNKPPKLKPKPKTLPRHNSEDKPDSGIPSSQAQTTTSKPLLKQLKKAMSLPAKFRFGNDHDQPATTKDPTKPSQLDKTHSTGDTIREQTESDTYDKFMYTAESSSNKNNSNNSDDENYTSLDSTYERIETHNYEKFLKESTTTIYAEPNTQQTKPLPPTPNQTANPLPSTPPNPVNQRPPPENESENLTTNQVMDNDLAELTREDIYEEISRLPKNISHLTVRAVSNILTGLNMAEYVKLFVDEQVDGSMLLSMDKESLESLDVKAFHVQKLLKFIAGWRPRH